MSYRRHPLEITPLVFGLVFLGIVAGWALFETGVLTGASTAWVLPVVLIAAGALGLVLAAVRPRQTTGPEYPGLDDTATQVAPTTTPEPTEPTEPAEPTGATENEEHRHD
jgi:hypothetical protein